MNANEFLKHYMPLIGTKVNDKVFKTSKLTKTGILNKYIELYIVSKMSNAYKDNSEFDIVLILEEVIDICHELGIEEAKEWQNLDTIPHSIGNSKIGKDTLVMSFNSSLLCYMALLGKCSNCDICYGKNSNLMYSNEFLKGCIGQIALLLHSNSEKEFFNLLYNTIWSIYCQYSANELERIKYLRINVIGDILNNDQLKDIDTIAKTIVNAFNLNCAYSYTHNNELDLSIAQNIVFNCSDFSNGKNKECQTIFEFDIDNYNEDKEILCNGHCFNCPYCKSEFECRKVLFLAHGGQFEGIDQIESYFMAYLQYNKECDYLLFMRQLAMV